MIQLFQGVESKKNRRPGRKRLDRLGIQRRSSHLGPDTTVSGWGGGSSELKDGAKGGRSYCPGGENNEN